MKFIKIYQTPELIHYLNADAIVDIYPQEYLRIYKIYIITVENRSYSMLVENYLNKKERDKRFEEIMRELEE